MAMRLLISAFTVLAYIYLSPSANAIVLNAGDSVLINFTAPAHTTLELDFTAIDLGDLSAPCVTQGVCITIQIEDSPSTGGGLGGKLSEFFFVSPDVNPYVYVKLQNGSADLEAFREYLQPIEASFILNPTDVPPLPPIVFAAIPEPSIWAMLLIGFAGLGFAGYRRARQKRAPAMVS
jgi:hypothetical protein